MIFFTYLINSPESTFDRHLAHMTKKVPFIPLTQFLVLFALPVLYAQQPLTVKVDSLYNQASRLEVQNLDSIKLIAERILRISTSTNYKYGIVKGKTLAALYYLNKFKLDTTKSLLDECEAFYKTHPSLSTSRSCAVVFYYQGERCYRKMQLDTAVAYVNKAFTIYEQQGDKFMMGAVLSQRATIEGLRENEAKALELYLKAYKYKLAARAPEKKYRRELEAIADIYTSMGEFEKGLSFMRKLLSIDLENKNAISIVGTYNFLGEIKSSLGEPDSALYYIAMGKHVAKLANNVALIAAADYHTGSIYTKAKRYRESVKSLFPLLKTSFSAHSSMAEYVRTLLAHNYLQLGKYDSAIRYGQSAYSIAYKNDRKEQMEGITQTLAQAFHALNKNDSAYKYLTLHESLVKEGYSRENQRKVSTLCRDGNPCKEKRNRDPRKRKSSSEC
jgi:tetratricopeptide (TPR) repeat protein